MNATARLHALGQSLWLDNITRELLNNGTLRRYYEQLSVTGLTSNPTIFDQAIRNTDAYDEAIRYKTKEGKSGDVLFFELAIEDLTRAAAVFRRTYEASEGIDGWVSLELSPLLANDTEATIQAAKRLHAQAQCPNLFIKIPGNAAGVPAIEEAIFAGIPINVTLLFSRRQYLAAADAYRRGIQRRIAAGLDPKVNSVASIFVSRWDKAVAGKVPSALNNCLGLAVSRQIYRSYREHIATEEAQTFKRTGAFSQRLLWASTSSKDPQLAETYYVEALMAPNTISTMSEKTLGALAERNRLNDVMEEDGGDAEAILTQFSQVGVDIEELATQLQLEGVQSFSKSWGKLLAVIADKSGVRPA
ncbi:transaldolase [Collimonas pratensis]|uniref:transaldolase n=1 Tax=Collimonas pratensis TaxID=279113 RepID=UPI000783DCBB|nr:transaldolase [Collimonas pratensis]